MWSVDYVTKAESQAAGRGRLSKPLAGELIQSMAVKTSKRHKQLHQGSQGGGNLSPPTLCNTPLMVIGVLW